MVNENKSFEVIKKKKKKMKQKEEEEDEEKEVGSYSGSGGKAIKGTIMKTILNNRVKTISVNCRQQ